jgi:alkylation response protein AidB-like acyl-CoA dehydrogenase
MRFAFTADQEELRRGARRFLAQASSSRHVRTAMATEQGFDGAVWKRIALELQWPALIIPEEHGGAGLSWVELTALLEETGAALLCSPFFSTVCLGVNALLASGNAAQCAALLPDIAAGTTTATLALDDVVGNEVVARPDTEGFVLSGAKAHVIDGHTADLLVVVARAPGARGREGVRLFAMPATTSGIERRHTPALDATRKQAEIVLRDVRVPRSALLGDAGAGGGGSAVLDVIVDRARAAVAVEQVGGAQRCLDMALAYAQERHQFGRPIGSFQAIKHKLADMLTDVETARAAAYAAGFAAAHDVTELSMAAPIAKAWCSDAFFRCAAESIQIHGGIGFTWEHDAHLYFKRAKSTETFLGDATAHRELCAQRMAL